MTWLQGYKNRTIKYFGTSCLGLNPSMSRFPAIPPNKLTEAQVGVHKCTAEIFSRLPRVIVSKDDEGHLLGPYSPLL